MLKEMKRIILLWIFLILCYGFLKSQFVSIPDTNLRTRLIQLFPSCFNAQNQMDTTCNGILNVSSLDLSGKNLVNLSGIEYFKGLQWLDCSGNQIVKLFILPPNITFLNCKNNKIDSINFLPSTLISAEIDFNRLKTLPQLPSNLQYLYCSFNRLENLPNLPNNLIEINCSNNLLKNLPNLPNSLQKLACGKNQLTYLPSLPPNLQFLDCPDNYLHAIPQLPNTLKRLWCSNNQLTILPSLNYGLLDLMCQDNKLLNCSPMLPVTLISAYFTNTGITCLSNIPNGATIYPANLGICTQSTFCETKPFVSGKVYIDRNNNGLFDGNDSLLQGYIIHNLTNNWSYSTQANGEYTAFLDSGVINQLVLVNPFNHYFTITPNSYSISPSSNGSQGNNFDFGIYADGVDLVTDVTAARAVRGFPQRLTLTYMNLGIIPMNQNVILKLVKPTSFGYSSASVTPSAFYGDTVVWYNLSLNALQSKWIDLFFSIPPNATLGDTLTYIAIIEPILIDSFPQNNIFVYQDIIRGSYDPNDKQVQPEFIDFDNPQTLFYTIRFQNTGTDTAFTVIIRDTLSSFLDINTFKILSSSHRYSFSIQDQNVIHFFFNHILLPDSFTNEPESHGFIKYSIQPKKNLPQNTVIKNTAYIYFDFNDPIQTNTVTTQQLVNRAKMKLLDSKIFPNPTQDWIKVEISRPYAELLLFDEFGRIVFSKNLVNGEVLSLKDLPNGIYLCNLRYKDEFFETKIIKR